MSTSTSIAANDTYGDMVEMGMRDPSKVTLYALQNAASVAGLMLTAECMMAELPQGVQPTPDTRVAHGYSPEIIQAVAGTSGVRRGPSHALRATITISRLNRRGASR